MATHICIIGVGYVGLVSAACFAECGHMVTCLDIDESKIERLKQGQIPIYEPGLERLVEQNFKAGRMYFTTQYSEAIARSSVLMLCVDTPCYGDEGKVDLRPVRSVARSIASHLKPGDSKIVCTKSTVPVGTAKEISQIITEILKERGVLDKIEVRYCSNPEFLKEGCAIKDFMEPDRVVIGAETPEVGDILRNIYLFAGSTAMKVSEHQIQVMDIASAELTKYASNAMLAVRISYMNWLAGLCEITGANIEDVKAGMSKDKRIGEYFLNAGIGYGGSCLPKDVKGLRAKARDLQYPTQLLDAVDTVNTTQKHSIAKKMHKYYRGSIHGKTIAVLGLAFKPGTDDMREAPALTIIADLLNYNVGQLRVFDPVAQENARAILTNRFPSETRITYCSSALETVDDADGIVLVTEWPQFKTLDYSEVKQRMRAAVPVLFDGRNLFNGAKIAALGFDYFSIGRPPVFAADPTEQHLISA